MNEKFKSILTSVNPEIFDDPVLDLVEDGIIDSFDIMTIIAKCEEAFDVDFDPNDVTTENFSSPKSIWAVIQKYLDEKNCV